MRFKVRKIFSPSVLIFLLIVIALTSIYWVWLIMPTRPLGIVVLNKNVPASSIDKNNNLAGDYRKHMGLYWVLKNQRYTNPENKSFYDYKTDYYGPIIDKDSNIIGAKNLEKLDPIPDLIYLADGYGDGNISDLTIEKGITTNDIGVISSSYTQGSRLIGEFSISSYPTKPEIKKELENLFGIKYTGWIGRFVLNMQNKDDVPPWALSLYETQYGKVWDLTGSGILLVSDKEELIILQNGVDYNQDSVTISILPKFQSKFGKMSVNYYNWFEITKVNYGTEIVAEYRLPLTDKGKSKFSKISPEFVFPAITKNTVNNNSSYYFSGDFNDYTIAEKASEYLIAEKFNQVFSYEKKGDITNFFWKFYVPFMREILDETYEISKVNKESIQTPQASIKISNGRFEISSDKGFVPFKIKGFNISATMPGDDLYNYTRDISIYQELLTSLSEMGGNTVRAYDLLPPEFYRALYQHNKTKPNNEIFLFQSINPPTAIEKGALLSNEAEEEINKNIHDIIDAIHGNAKVNASGKRQSGEYYNDVSSYLVSYLAEMDITVDTINYLNSKNAGYIFKGDYFECTGSPSEAFMAKMCNEIMRYENLKYKTTKPIGAQGNVLTIENAPWKSEVTKGLYDPARIAVNEESKDKFFVAYSAFPSDKIMLDNKKLFDAYKDSTGAFPYGGYINSIFKSSTKYPIFIDKFGLSTNTNAFEKENSINGLTEYEQGTGIIRMIEAIESQESLGGLVSDLNDNWSQSSLEFDPYVIPKSNKPLWQNALDPYQNKGVIAVEPYLTDEIGMSLQDFGRMTQLISTANESYLHLTVLMRDEIDYDNEKLMIGIDTYQRNSGEYLYDPGFFATSLSGLEYLIKFDSNRSASLYVIPQYNRNKQKYSSVESNKGIYDFICALKYGTFETSNSNFYMAGTNIHIRIPWSLLNFTDPSKKMVIEDKRTLKEILSDPFGIRTQTTNGIIFSVVISDIKTKDTLYQFPNNKQSTGYKTFSWINWEKVKYRIRPKESMAIIERYYKTQE